MLKVNQPMLQLQVLKLIKSQMPWCGRKWRQGEIGHNEYFRLRILTHAISAAGNMKVITSIYLNCRPELRDDWLAGTDQDTELEDAVVRLSLQTTPMTRFDVVLSAARYCPSDSRAVLQPPALHSPCPTFA